MIFLLLLILITPSISYADIFSKAPDQGQLDQAIAKDTYNFYYKKPYDYNAYAPHENAFKLKREHIALGANRYDFHQSLKNFMIDQDFNSLEVDEIMNRLTLPSSRLLFWQYSSPSVADLYKHLQTVGTLRVGFRYQQYADLENSLDDPIVKLRKQAVLDCMRNKNLISKRNDIDASFKECFDDLDARAIDPYQFLEDPQDGRDFVTDRVDVSEKTLERVNLNGEDIETVINIIPRVLVNPDSVYIQTPQIKSRELIAQYHREFLTKIVQLINNYKRSRRVNPEELSDFLVFGVPLTEGQVKNIAMQGETAAYLTMNKIASNLAYLKAIDQYLLASEMLGRVMNHPAIQPGYKTLLKSTVEFVDKEITTLKDEKERLSQYADTMRHVVNEADELRKNTMNDIKLKSEAQQDKGLFGLNP